MIATTGFMQLLNDDGSPCYDIDPSEWTVTTNCTEGDVEWVIPSEAQVYTIRPTVTAGR